MTQAPEPQGVRGSRLTGVAATARIILGETAGYVPGGHVMSGRWEVFYLAVCRECDDLVLPFPTAKDRDDWAVRHPHEVAIGVELRR